MMSSFRLWLLFVVWLLRVQGVRRRSQTYRGLRFVGQMGRLDEQCAALNRLHRNGDIPANHVGVMNQLRARVPAFAILLAERHDAPIETFQGGTNPKIRHQRSKESASGAGQL